MRNRNFVAALPFLFAVALFVFSVSYQVWVGYECHKNGGTLVRSFWTQLPTCIEAKR